MSLSVAPVFPFGELPSPGLWTPALCAPCLGFSYVVSKGNHFIASLVLQGHLPCLLLLKSWTCCRVFVQPAACLRFPAFLTKARWVCLEPGPVHRLPNILEGMLSASGML